jgi:hypothetical protein
MDVTKTFDLSGSEWTEVSMDGWKPHVLPVTMVSDLIEDGIGRLHGFSSAEPAIGCFLDRPGMVMVDRSYQDLSCDGLTLTIPTQDFDYFYTKLAESPTRWFASKTPYHKVHAWLRCLVVSPEQKNALLALMAARMPEVRVKATEEELEFERRMKQIKRGT